MQVAIQGIKGCFHEIAALKYFGEYANFKAIECHTFPKLIKEVKAQPHQYALMAIENTVAGTILPNYALLRNSPHKIIGEVYLRIQQNLLALNGRSIAQLNEVHSHPMAILQCQHFFEQYPHIRLVETSDTALSAKQVQEGNRQAVGAIASHLAAEYYQLNVLAESIETNKKNYTRFLVLQHANMVPTPQYVPSKASICFNLSHQVGALAKVLQTFAEHHINLSKIQSLPILGKVWEYFFHLDLEFEQYDNYKRALNTIGKYATQIQILGEYQKGRKHQSI